jgi:hypothetical protein
VRAAHCGCWCCSGYCGTAAGRDYFGSLEISQPGEMCRDPGSRQKAGFEDSQQQCQHALRPRKSGECSTLHAAGSWGFCCAVQGPCQLNPFFRHSKTLQATPSTGRQQQSMAMPRKPRCLCFVAAYRLNSLVRRSSRQVTSQPAVSSLAVRTRRFADSQSGCELYQRVAVDPFAPQSKSAPTSNGAGDSDQDQQGAASRWRFACAVGCGAVDSLRSSSPLLSYSGGYHITGACCDMQQH